jgi:hypothetical protein
MVQLPSPRTLLLAAPLLAVVMIAGCAPAGGDAPGPGQAPDQTPAGTFQSIALTTTGGFAGVHRTVTIDAAGSVTVRRSTGTQPSPATPLTAAQTGRLRTLTSSAAFRSAQPVYGPADPKVSDQFTNELTTGYADGQRTVRVEDPTLAPGEVAEVIDLLNRAGAPGGAGS